MLELIQLALEQLQLYSTPTSLVEDIFLHMEKQQKWGECRSSERNLNKNFLFLHAFFACIGANHPSRSMCCQNFDLVGNKLKSCPRYCENIVYTEEKTATPKRQIRLKMAGIQSADNVKKTHEVLVSGGSTNSIAQ